MTSFLKRLFPLDSRSLALFRILLGLFLVGDLIARIANLTEFYSDAGVLPRSALISHFANSWSISPMNSVGHPTLVFTYMLLALAAYLGFLIGYQTRWMTFLSWIFFTSFSARNPAVAHGGDDLVRLCLFWSLFINLDQHWALKRSTPLPNSPVASAAFILQLLGMYQWTALLKWHPRWYTEGTAVYYALHLESFAKPFGQWLLQSPIAILKTMSLSTFYLELLGPALWLLAYNLWKVRAGLIAIFIIFHWGLMLSLELGPFPYACAIYWIALVPSQSWDSLKRAWPQLFRSLPQEAYGSYPGFQWGFKAWLYQARDAVIVFCMAIALVWQIAVFSETDRLELSEFSYRVGNLLRLHQRWDMFAPYPRVGDSWIVIDAQLADGTHYDIFNDRAISFDKPSNLADSLHDTLWRKYLTNLSSHLFRKHLPYFSDWLCRNWNQDQVPRPEAYRIKIWVVEEHTPKPGAPTEPPQPLVIWSQNCRPASVQ